MRKGLVGFIRGTQRATEKVAESCNGSGRDNLHLRTFLIAKLP
jgi:hypothetical protein